jgi:hypothetical protein
MSAFLYRSDCYYYLQAQSHEHFKITDEYTTISCLHLVIVHVMKQARPLKSDMSLLSHNGEVVYYIAITSALRLMIIYCMFNSSTESSTKTIRFEPY